MNMQELKELVYKGEKVDIECKKAEKMFQYLHMSHILHLLILRAVISYWV